jgi:hypothetical protein
MALVRYDASSPPGCVTPGKLAHELVYRLDILVGDSAQGDFCTIVQMFAGVEMLDRLLSF